ncbi:MAG: DUF4139 domain-containing protein, partial [bacterium]
MSLRHALAWGSLALLSLTIITPSIAAGGTHAETTSGDQQSVAITVYNDGQGLVRDLRTITLPTGPVSLAWRDVASSMITQSVSLVDETDPNALGILEQNYQYDLIDRTKLIDKYLGKMVGIQVYDYVTEKYVNKQGLLLSQDVIQIDGKIYPGIPGQLILPELPGGLISIPTLQWELTNSAAGPQNVSMSYLTGGLSWQADYVAVVNVDDTGLDLNGWTTITNNSGAVYHNALLKLIAGDVHRVQPPQPMGYGGGVAMDMAESMPAAPQFEEKSFFEYHLYTLQRPATLMNNEQKQIALFDAAHTPAVKKFIMDAPGDYWYGNADSQKIDIAVKMEFQNKQEYGLGIPLPKGTVRVYKADTD